MTGSYKTSIVGWVLIASSALGLIGDSIAKSGIPDTFQEWFALGTALVAGIGALLAKDYDKSNAPVPVAVANTVPTAAVQ